MIKIIISLVIGCCIGIFIVSLLTVSKIADNNSTYTPTLIRCHNCEYKRKRRLDGSTKLYCSKLMAIVSPTDYCSWAEHQIQTKHNTEN